MNAEINKVVKILNEGGIILYPTDTVWGIGCDATNADAVDKIYKLKQRTETKAMICLVADDRMLKKYIKEIPSTALDIIELTDKPTTIVYDQPQNLAKNLIGNDNTIAIRIPNDDFCFNLIRKLNKPLVSTSANFSGENAPKSFKKISKDILKGVDYVVNLYREKKENNPSSIIKLSNDGTFKIIRK